MAVAACQAHSCSGLHGVAWAGLPVVVALPGVGVVLPDLAGAQGIGILSLVISMTICGVVKLKKEVFPPDVCARCVIICVEKGNSKKT